MDCTSFEIAIEQQRRGALPAGSEAELRDHLATCAACRRYADAAARTDAVLGAAAAEVVAGADWSRLEAGLRRQLASGVRRVAFDLLAAALVVPATLLWAIPAGRRGEVAPWLLAGAAAVLLLRAAYHGWLARRALALRGEDLLAFYRAALRADLWRALAGRWLALGVSLALGAAALSARELPAGLLLAGGALLVAGTWGYVLLVRVPRLRRQLEALGPDRGGR